MISGITPKINGLSCVELHLHRVIADGPAVASRARLVYVSTSQGGMDVLGEVTVPQGLLDSEVVRQKAEELMLLIEQAVNSVVAVPGSGGVATRLVQDDDSSGMF